ncbi:MAG TPA: uroporphyrinogen decarboxylase [Pseudomonadales bacterium]|nr:uroporphyrinogen decarboxylase [Pseudomonadales bacterium]
MPHDARTNSVFLKACRGEPVPYTPIWLNRQAGRYMREYHAVKGTTPSLDFFKTPELAARVTLDAQRILGVDAAIMFADLLPVLEPMGMRLSYEPGEGPVFANPVRSAKDVSRLAVVPADEGTPYIRETITRILDDLPQSAALIGFAGAPFTLASYAIEGRGSRNYTWVKKMMYSAPQLWDALMTKLVQVIADYVRLQIDSGVHAVQVFDSWIGVLSIGDYRRYVAQHSKALIDRIGGRVPIIYFGTGNPHLVDDMFAAGPDVLAVDWRTPLRATWDRLRCRAIQGNLDPIVLCADRAAITEQTQAILDEVGGRPGHIFNLGHGIVPETPVDNVKYLVDLVHERSARA